MAVENLLALLLLIPAQVSKMGGTPQKPKSTDTADSRHKKGGPTQSRLNLTNHHYKEPYQAI